MGYLEIGLRTEKSESFRGSTRKGYYQISNVENPASYASDSFYKEERMGSGFCDFKDEATITNMEPGAKQDFPCCSFSCYSRSLRTLWFINGILIRDE